MKTKKKYPIVVIHVKSGCADVVAKNRGVVVIVKDFDSGYCDGDPKNDRPLIEEWSAGIVIKQEDNQP